MSPNVATMRAFWAEPPNSGVIRESSLALPGEGEVLVETVYSAVSRGTETLVHLGCVPESQYECMRAPFQDGVFPGPVKYGYMNVGRIVMGPEALKRRTVFCLYPHQTAYVVSQADVIVVPEEVPASRAVLAANMETALNAIWDGDVGQSHRVAVIGAGVVGCLTAYLAAHMSGAEVELVDIDESKREVARALDLDFRSCEAVGHDFDRVFHASGTEAGLRMALSIAAFEAEIIELSWFGDDPVSVPLGEQFHSQRLTLKSSQVGHVAPAFRDTWTRRARLAYALSLLEDPALDALISGESRFEDLPATMARLTGDAKGVLCHRIAYRPATGHSSTA